MFRANPKTINQKAVNNFQPQKFTLINECSASALSLSRFLRLSRSKDAPPFELYARRRTFFGIGFGDDLLDASMKTEALASLKSYKNFPFVRNKNCRKVM